MAVKFPAGSLTRTKDSSISRLNILERKKTIEIQSPSAASRQDGNKCSGRQLLLYGVACFPGLLFWGIVLFLGKILGNTLRFAGLGFVPEAIDHVAKRFLDKVDRQSSQRY